MNNKSNPFARVIMLKIFFIIIIIFLFILISSCNEESISKEVEEDFGTTDSTTTQFIEESKETEVSVHTKTISYYQIQLEFITDSDWSQLEILNTDDIYAVQIENTIGNIPRYRVNSKYLQMFQSIQATEKNEKVGLTVNYAISPNALSEPVNFTLSKGTINGSYINIYYIDGNNKQLIQKVEHTGIVENDPSYNPKDFTLDLSKLKNVIPKQFEIKEKAEEIKKMVWAFYYPWFDLNTWSRDILKDKPKILYESNNPSTISTQIDQAKSAGIDGFIYSWGGGVDSNLDTILNIAKEKEFSIAILFETLSVNGPREKDDILKWLRYVIVNLGDHPAYANIKGKPIIVIYETGSLPLDDWKSVFEQLRKEGYDATFIGMGYYIDNLDFFDGIYEYAVFNIPDLSELYNSTSKVTHNYQIFKKSEVYKIFAATVQPGYDDRLIPGREGNYKDREEGAFYRKTFEAAITSDPDFIFITSWNEWYENTHIEPSILYENKYLDITRDYTKMWKEEKVDN